MNTPLTGWKHLTVACAADDLPGALEKFGSEGWELASALPMNIPPQGRLVVNGAAPQMGVLLIFKRPVTSQAEPA